VLGQEGELVGHDAFERLTDVDVEVTATLDVIALYWPASSTASPTRQTRHAGPSHHVL
jgi:hypothetical protein